jgi:hypothetical protein
MEEVWIPEVGKLILRQTLGPCSNELRLTFRDDPKNPCHEQCIAIARDFKTKAYTATWYEYVKGASGYAASGDVIVRRPATDRDIKLLTMFWEDQSISILSWLDEVKCITVLAEDEKERIARITRET